MFKIKRDLFVCFVSGIIAVSSLAVKAPVTADVVPVSDNENVSPGFSSLSYRNYMEQFKGDFPAAGDIDIEAVSYETASEDTEVTISSEYESRKDVLLWQSQGGEVEWTVEIAKAAKYMIELEYYVLTKESRNVEIGIQINNEYPFGSASNIIMPRYFYTEEEIVPDERGNDIRPFYKGLDVWITHSLQDSSGLFSEPYQFHFEEGINTIKLVGVRAGIAISSIRLYTPEKLPSYEEYLSSDHRSVRTEPVLIEGEDPIFVTDSILYPTFDRSGPDTSPSDPVKLRLNTIGQSNWSMHGQSITWEVNVPAKGYYYLGIRFQQNLMRNVTSYRRLYINGKVPFREADALAFEFSDKWQTGIIGNGWQILLDKGQNEITLEAVPGPVGEVIADLEQTIFEMNNIYRKIIMITGVNADPNRDYQLEKEIPGLIESISSIRASCQNSISKLTELSGRNTAATTSALDRVVIQFSSFLDKPETIAVRVSRLRDNISSLSALIINLKNQPLEIDYLTVGSGNEIFRENKSIVDKMWFSLKSFIGSFFEDYSSIGVEYDGEEPVNVWVNMGRDQTQVIKTMSDSMFTPRTGIPVNIRLVQQSLVQASLSNEGPDVVIFVGQNEPVNLAARNALVDISSFPGFEETLSRFHKNAIIPYQYNGGVYALPVTEDFLMMYYRKDVFYELEIEPPKTWEDFYKVMSVLQRNNMSAGIPNMPPDSQMSTNTGIFAMLIYQMGGTYFNNDRSSTEFDSVIGVEAFKQWTGFYSKYGLPYQYDFFNRFRTGEMPIGLSSYTMFNMLAIGAPEIKGLWEMLPIPGVQDNDGKINNQSIASGSAMIMLRKANDPDSAWKFMEWFTSDDTQLDFGLQMESLLGASGRYNTANRNSFRNLPWSAKEQKMISEQWEQIIELPQVPGGYYIDRNLTNAFRQVVFLHKNPREVLLDYNKEINLEIRRKRTEFGLD